MLAFAGVVSGLLVGAWLAPKLFADGDSWVPVASLIGAAAGGFAFGLATGRLAATANLFLTARPALRTIDRAGGAVGGALVALALAWAAAVVFLHQPALGLRTAVQESTILPRLVRAVPPEPVLRALERFDPLPLLPQQLAPQGLPDPDPSVLRSPGARAAAGSVLKVEGTSCGLGVQGSGWVVRPGVVATNAHVVSGQRDTTVIAPGGPRWDATIVYVDGRNDVALLRVDGLRAASLGIAGEGPYPRDVVLLGYPQDGALTAGAGTAGRPRTVIAPDAYERGARPRRVVPLRGRVRPGQSGGPVVDEMGRVVAMVFGGQRGGSGGFAVPVDLVTRGLAGRLEPVSPGPCVG